MVPVGLALDRLRDNGVTWIGPDGSGAGGAGGGGGSGAGGGVGGGGSGAGGVGGGVPGGTAVTVMVTGTRSIVLKLLGPD